MLLARDSDESGEGNGKCDSEASPRLGRGPASGSLDPFWLLRWPAYRWRCWRRHRRRHRHRPRRSPSPTSVRSRGPAAPRTATRRPGSRRASRCRTPRAVCTGTSSCRSCSTTRRTPPTSPPSCRRPTPRPSASSRRARCSSWPPSTPTRPASRSRAPTTTAPSGGRSPTRTCSPPTRAASIPSTPSTRRSGASSRRTAAPCSAPTATASRPLRAGPPSRRPLLPARRRQDGRVGHVDPVRERQLHQHCARRQAEGHQFDGAGHGRQLELHAGPRRSTRPGST